MQYNDLLNIVVDDLKFICDSENLYQDTDEFEWEYNRLGHCISIIVIGDLHYKINAHMNTTDAKELLNIIDTSNSKYYIFNMTKKEDSVFGNIVEYLTKKGFQKTTSFRIIYNYEDIISNISDFDEKTIFERICEFYEI